MGSKRFALGRGVHPWCWRPVGGFVEIVHLLVEVRAGRGVMFLVRDLNPRPGRSSAKSVALNSKYVLIEPPGLNASTLGHLLVS